MPPKPLVAAACVLATLCAARQSPAQCAEMNYVRDGAPSAQLDCQPTASLQAIEPESITAADRATLDLHHAELRQAARFYGFDIDAPGWTFQQQRSPLLTRHLLVTYTNATPSSHASRFAAIVPLAAGEKVEVLPAFAHGLHPYLPGWQTRGTYSAFNRLLLSERGSQPVTNRSTWIEFAVLYLALAGHDARIPIDTDSIKATWDLAAKRATTPVFETHKDGSADIAFSDLADKRSAAWKLSFSKTGEIVKAERTDSAPRKIHTMQTLDTNTGAFLNPPPKP